MSKLNSAIRNADERYLNNDFISDKKDIDESKEIKKKIKAEISKIVDHQQNKNVIRIWSSSIKLDNGLQRSKL